MEQPRQDRTRELGAAKARPRQNEPLPTAAVDRAQQLQRVATQLVTIEGTEALYEQILDTALVILQADFGSIQMYYRDHGVNGALRLLGHRGFSAEAAKRWAWVTESTRTLCGEALRTGQRVSVPDVRDCSFMSGSEDLEGYLEAMIRAGQTTPLISRAGALLGTVSTYWRERHEMSASEVSALDVLARLAADLIERSHAEEKLRESEERFRRMADSAPVMIWISDTNKLCTFFNKPWLDFTGRMLEQELGNGWADAVHPEDLDRCLATYHSSFDARQAFQMEYRLRRKDGEYRWILDRGAPLYQAGEFTGFIGSCVEINDQKLIEARLLASEARLTDAHRLAKTGSWERDLTTNVSFWSPELLEILGLPSDSPPGLEAFAALVHPKDRDKVFRVDRLVRETAEPLETEYRIIRPDGETRFVRSIIEASRDDQGSAKLIRGATQDITDQVQARELLRHSERRLKNAERLAHVGNWEWDLRTNHVSWSEEIFHIFGKPLDFIPSYEGFLESVLPQDKHRVEQTIEQSISGKTRFYEEIQIVLPSGALRIITIVGEVLLNEEGAPERIIGATQDVTDARRAQLEDVARQKLESIGTLAGGIAHDFNNLLSGVLAQAELGLEEVGIGSKPAEELKSIRELALRGSEIVRELMIYAGKEAGTVEVVDISNIVEEMLGLLKVSVSKRAVLKANLARDLPMVSANTARLQQVVMNLVINASDAIGDLDGVISVATRRVEAGRELPNWNAEACSPDRDYVQLEVSDTGRGILLEEQGKIFDPFFTTKATGHGLGLAIVQGIVRSLGGAIQVRSKPSAGTTFQVLLPSVQTPQGPTDSHEPSTIESSRPPACTVLIVDDENPLREALAKRLRMRGVEALEAADGSDAISLLRAHATKIDLVLLDITIPGASSVEVVAEAAKVQPDIKVILTSAYSQELTSDEMRSPQIKGFIRKPFRFEALIQAIQNALS